jgi:hypothetical protein
MVGSGRRTRSEYRKFEVFGVCENQVLTSGHEEEGVAMALAMVSGKKRSAKAKQRNDLPKTREKKKFLVIR